MFASLAAIVLLGSGVSTAQEAPDTSESPPPDPAPPTEEPSAEELADDIDAFLADQPAPPTKAPPQAAAPNAFNPRITAFGDLLTTVGFDGDGVMPGSGPWLRSFELDFQADVDPFAKAVAVVALHQESPDLEGSHDEEAEAAEDEAHAHGAASFEVAPEEVYIDLVSLPGGLSSRIGQQRLPFGITNRMHPHDWAWPDAPLPFEAVMGEEGMADVAGTLAWRIPNPWAVAFTVTGAVTSGDIFDTEREDPVPGWLGRAEYFGDYGAVEVGLGASSTGLGAFHTDGADAMLRWRADAGRSVVLMGEAFRAVGEEEHTHSEEEDAGHDDVAPIGWTSTLQLQPSRPIYIGLRVDELEGDWQYAGFLSYYTSEFLRLRGGATTDLDTWIANAQLTFVWGSHPVEPYWVNR